MSNYSKQKVVFPMISMKTGILFLLQLLIAGFIRQTNITSNINAQESAKRLPSSVFSYGGDCGNYKGGCPLTAFTADVVTTQSKTANDFFLKTIDNGYNGKIVFEYEGGDDGYNAFNIRYCNPDKTGLEDPGCKTDHAYNTQRHRVKRVITYDGMGNYYAADHNFLGDGANQGLAYVEEYGEESAECDLEIDTENPIGVCGGDPPGCASPCSWNTSNLACCDSGYKEYECNGDPGGCSDTYGIRLCVPDCKRTYFSGYEFLGYPEVETLTYEKNSTVNIASKSYAYYHQALETDTCFKPSPLSGVSALGKVIDADNSTKWNESKQTFKVRFGDMNTPNEWVEKTDSELDSYCESYIPGETVSLVIPVDTISSNIINSQKTLCTKSTLQYNPTDPYAMPNKSIAWGKVDCNTYEDINDLTPIVSYTNYTPANTLNTWILPLPCENWMSDLNNLTKFNHTKTYFLGMNTACDTNAFPILTKIIKNETLKDNLPYSVSTISYDTTYPWLPVSITDVLGNITSTVFDSVYHIYPVSVTNAKGQTVTTEYDFNTPDTTHPNYAGVRGLPVKTIGLNGDTTTNVYDDFGRIKETYYTGRSPSTHTPNKFFDYYYFNEDDFPDFCETQHNCLIGLGKQIDPINNLGPKMMISEAVRFNDNGTIGTIGGTHKYINGIGQSVQTRNVWYDGEWSDAGYSIDGGLYDIIRSQTFNSLGQTEYQSEIYTANPYPFAGESLENSYDARDFIADSGINKVHNVYDGFGRIIQTENPDGSSDKTLYELNGNPLKVKYLDPNCTDDNSATPCSEIVTTSNSFGQTIKSEAISSAKTYSTRYEYHEILGVNTKTFDTLGNAVTINEYDTIGRKTKSWNIDMCPAMSGDENSWRYFYDKAGNITKQTDPNNISTILEYDVLNRLLTKHVNGERTLSNSYDICTNGIGKLCSTASYTPNGTISKRESYIYNKRGLLDYKLDGLEGVDFPDTILNGRYFQTQFTYDEADRPLSVKYGGDVTIGIPDETVSYIYDRANLSGITGYANNALYNKDSQVISYRSANNVQNSFSYRTDNHLLNSISITQGSITDAQRLMLAYEYDSAGNITRIIDNNPSRPSDFKLNQTFTYDPLYRLLSTSGSYNSNYSYDDIGNITSKNEGGTQISLTYGDYQSGYYHRPESYISDTVVHSFVYDNLGNTVSNGSNLYNYDADNRLINTGSAAAPKVTPTIAPPTTPGDCSGLQLCLCQCPEGYLPWNNNCETLGGTCNGTCECLLNGAPTPTPGVIPTDFNQPLPSSTPTPTTEPLPTSVPTSTPIPTPSICTPNILEPKSMSVIQTRDVYISWSDECPYSNIVAYEISVNAQVFNYQEIVPVPVNYSVVNGSEIGLTYRGNYTISIRSCLDKACTQTGGWSPAVSFTWQPALGYVCDNQGWVCSQSECYYNSDDSCVLSCEECDGMHKECSSSGDGCFYYSGEGYDICLYDNECAITIPTPTPDPGSCVCRNNKVTRNNCIDTTPICKENACFCEVNTLGVSSSKEEVLSTTDPINFVNFAYDAIGQRIAKLIYGSDHTYYISPGLEVVFNPDGSLKLWRRNFSFLGNLSAVRIGQAGSESKSFIHSDHLGSVAISTDQNGAVISQQVYYPYGNVRTSLGTSPTERGYTGQISDYADTNLYYYNARYYNPIIAKFTQADSASDGLNKYAYVGNNPINATDPTGHMAGQSYMHDWDESPASNCDTSDYYCRHQETDFDPYTDIVPLNESNIDIYNYNIPSSDATNYLALLASSTSQTTPPWWWQYYHFMKHASYAGFNGYTIQSVKGFLGFITNNIVRGASEIYHRPGGVDINGNAIKEAYIFVKEVAGQKWAAFITPNGKIITAFNLGISKGSYTAKEEARQFGKIVSSSKITDYSNLPRLITRDWIKNTPSIIKVFLGSFGYHALLEIERFSVNYSSFIRAPILVVPKGIFECGPLNPIMCGYDDNKT